MIIVTKHDSLTSQEGIQGPGAIFEAKCDTCGREAGGRCIVDWRLLFGASQAEIDLRVATEIEVFRKNLESFVATCDHR